MDNKNRMRKSDKKFLLKTAKELVARCSEYTPPEINTSNINAEIARAMLAIENVLKLV